MSKSLLDQTKELLARQRGLLSRREIADRAGVNRHWLEKFDQGVIKSPTVANLERLHDWLEAQAPIVSEHATAAPPSPAGQGG